MCRNTGTTHYFWSLIQKMFLFNLPSVLSFIFSLLRGQWQSKDWDSSVYGAAIFRQHPLSGRFDSQHGKEKRREEDTRGKEERGRETCEFCIWRAHLTWYLTTLSFFRAWILCKSCNVCKFPLGKGRRHRAWSVGTSSNSSTSCQLRSLGSSSWCSRSRRSYYEWPVGHSNKWHPRFKYGFQWSLGWVGG